MRLNPFKTTPKQPVLLAITPPRNAERTVLGVENLLSSIAVPEPFSLELCGDADGVTLLARCLDQEVVRQQLSAHYPQARIHQLEPEDDPLSLAEGEQAWQMRLRASGPEYVPLRVFRDDDLLDPGSDPLIALLGALSALRPGERVVARLRLRSLGPEWSQGHQARAHQPAVRDRTDSYQISESRRHRVEIAGASVLGVAAVGALQGYRWWQAGEEWKTLALGAGVMLTLALAGWAWARWQRSRNRVFDPLLIREKVSRIAFEADIEVVAIVPGDDAKRGRRRAQELLEPVAAAYRHYDHPAGARLRAGKVRPLVPDPAALHPAPAGLFRSRSVLGVREAAALWHPPGAKDETPLVARSGAKVLLPSARGAADGAHVGETTAGKRRPVHFPGDLLRRHHLYVARTRMGKSTLMLHLVAHKLREKAAGRDGDAIVVVDPHADLVADILEHVPEELVGQVRLVDCSGRGGYPGINLLDTRVFSDRDRTADSVVRVARGLWEQWGPRMQSILEHLVKTLHEANSHPDTAAEEQFTILDGLRVLSDENFRTLVLKRVRDEFLLDWWSREFTGWRREYRSDALAPVQTRLSYYASSERARAILGQPRSTIDLRSTILDGGVLLVSTAQGTAGRDVAALAGASILNLVDAVIREQGELPPEQRRGALVVVDEMQSMPGVAYESMLSELGKFGASFVLATQSLAKLADLSPTMQDTLLANIGCLAVFQVASADARRLVGELDRDRISEEDIVSLPVHHAYVRATVGSERMPAFSMEVLKPEDGNPLTAERVRDEAAGYLTTARDLDAAEADALERVRQFHEGLASMPFLDRLELAAVAGVSDRAAYRAVAALERRGLARSLLHGTERLRTTRRYHLTAAGLGRLAEIEDEPLHALLRDRPVSAQWRRILLERLDAVAVIYRLAASIAALRGAIGFRWYRALPMDASIVLPGGAVLAVVRQGATADRAGFAKRLWRLREGPAPGGVLLLAPDETRLRHARRLLATAPFPVLLALEREAVGAGPAHRAWRPPSVRGALGLRDALAYAAREAALPAERAPARATLPPDDLDAATTAGATPGWLLPARLGPAEKRTLDLVADWPWIAPRDLAVLLGLSRARLSRLVVSLEALGLAARIPAADGRLAAADRGLAVLARRDRTAVGLARNRWSPAPLDTGVAGTWRDVRGRNSRQLLRHLDHTAAVHRFVAVLAEQARAEGWEIAQLDPPRRASRYFRHGARVRSVHPDAFGVLRGDGQSWAFFLEWERRAVRPSTMAARLAPYLRYYASHRPTDDHGVRPAVLVVLRDGIAMDHFLRVARREMERVRVDLPLWVSHEALLDAEGPFGDAWRTAGGGAGARVAIATTA